ncbi:MAG: very short patch repair endonuclease [Thermodesulfobacteriota bacterium]
MTRGRGRHDTLTPKQRSVCMSRIRAKNTKPEMILRRLVHSLGYRYRLHSNDLPGRPDLVFGSRKKVIFVHGCFWHQHECMRTKQPKTHRNYWDNKLKGNRKRDLEVLSVLAELGWECLVVWECELEQGDQVRDRLLSFLGV